MTAHDEVAQTWRRMEGWLGAHAADVARWLRPPADESSIERVEAQIGCGLPADLRASLGVHDGQVENAAVWGRWEYHRVDAIAGAWSLLRGLVDQGAFTTDDDPLIATVGPVRPRWWDPAWIPFAVDMAGDRLCVDMNPAPGGTPGQVVLFVHDAAHRAVVATSFGAWLSETLAAMEAGHIVPDEFGESLEDRRP